MGAPVLINGTRYKEVGPPIDPKERPYMPLSAVAHWIASEGGAISITVDEKWWRPAFEKLLAAIVSNNRLAIVGRRNGLPETIPNAVFVGIPGDELPGLSAVYFLAGEHVGGGDDHTPCDDGDLGRIPTAFLNLPFGGLPACASPLMLRWKSLLLYTAVLLAAMTATASAQVPVPRLHMPVGAAEIESHDASYGIQARCCLRSVFAPRHDAAGAPTP
jgi:hypothetical protein